MFSSIYKKLITHTKVHKVLCLKIILILLFSICIQFSFAQEKTEIPEISDKELTHFGIKEGDILNKSSYFWVVYDNVCPYCRKATKHIKILDWEGRFKFLSYRDPFTYELFPKLSKQECEKDVHMVTPDGKVLVGYKVFRTIIDNLAATKLLNPLLHNDYAEKQLNEIYEKMVKERSCYYDKSETCVLEAHNEKDKGSKDEKN